jgi:hypothetical protein
MRVVVANIFLLVFFIFFETNFCSLEPTVAAQPLRYKRPYQEEYLKKEKTLQIECGCEDEEDDELSLLYLNHLLMDIGVKQVKKDANPKCRGCGHPKIPCCFLNKQHFNSKVDAEGRSFLTRAIQYKHKELVSLLLWAGVDINKPDGRGILPLEEAIEVDALSVYQKDEECMVGFLIKHGAKNE